MKTALSANKNGQQAASRKSRYRTLSLVELIQQIVEAGDLEALHEFHNNRPIFRYNNGPPLVLAEYLMELREGIIRRGSVHFITHEKADKAYDMTIEKFTNIPMSQETAKYKNGETNDI